MLDAIREATRRLGLAGALYFFASKALQRASRGQVRIFRYYLVAQPVSGPAQRRGGRITVRRVEPADPVCASFPRREKVIARRFAEGAICLVAEDGARFAGYLWLQPGPYDEDEVRCRYVMSPAPRCAWDFDVHVQPELRLGRTFARLWDAAHELLRERGVEWTMSRISAFNPESLRSHGRLGLQRLGTVTFLRVGRAQLMWSMRRPWLHASLDPAKAPRIVLRAPAMSPRGAARA